jgi:hypothetical protein
MVFMDHNLEHARNVKLLLTAFEQMSGLKINFHKSELFCYGLAKEYEDHYSCIFGCDISLMPFTFLGIPMTYRRLRNNEWQNVIARFEKRLSNCKGKFLSSGYFQANALVPVLETTVEGRITSRSPQCMPILGDGSYIYLHKSWMTIIY